jgi:hypothetical protein
MCLHCLHSLAPEVISQYYLLDSRRYQLERRCVIRCNERLAVRAAPIPYRGLGIAPRLNSRSYMKESRRADSNR